MQEKILQETIQQSSKSQNENQPEFEPKKSKIWQWAFIGLLILLVILCGACFWEYKKINCEKDEVVVSVA
ncbi:MAG: hypothetical protein ABIF17_04510, partial [Patescibacteria group bacterium]